jgi:hypothetical protein
MSRAVVIILDGATSSPATTPAQVCNKTGVIGEKRSHYCCSS